MDNNKHQRNHSDKPKEKEPLKSQKNGSSFSKIKEQFDEQWITQGIDDKAITFMEDAGNFMAPQFDNDKLALSSSQIRNVFGELKRIQMKGFSQSQSDFLLLKPKVAYAAKRKSSSEKETGMELFKFVFDNSFDAIISLKDIDARDKAFSNMCSLIEGIIAYHKYYGGK